MRTKGSCRFAPYFKAQWYDPAALSWRDVQKAHPAPPDLTGAEYDQKKRWRVMMITEKGRSPMV